MHRSSQVARSRYPLLVAALLALALAFVAVPAPPAYSSADDNGEIVEIPVSFEVENKNRSPIPCEVDGETYTVRGVLTAPEGALGSDEYDAVTLILHGLGYGSFFSNFEEVDGYDFAAKQARAGNITVAVDRLGYGQSDKPNGFDLCFGSRADIAHQLVEQLRSGTTTPRITTARASTRSCWPVTPSAG